MKTSILPVGTSPATPAGGLLGHPQGLTFLFATEMWERFSYYGMRALLMLYMIKFLLDPAHVETVLGFARLRSALEAVSGPLGIQPLASEIYGLYTGLVYLTPIFGGLLADRALGRRRTVILGALLMALGHFMMAFEPLFLGALLLLILGNGAFKPNISTQVGRLYAPGDPRRDRAYSIFYVGINLGAFLAPLVCGTLGEEIGWSYGFGAAGIGMSIGLAIYLWGWRALPADESAETRPEREKASLTRQDWRGVAALLILFLPTALFWAAYEQQGNTIVLWADNFTDRSVDLFLWQGDIPTTWFQAFNPFMIFAFTPPIVALWGWQAMRGTEPSTVAKMALGCAGCALAYLLLALAAREAGEGRASWLWLLGYFVVLTIAELYLSPTGLSLVTKLAPASILSLMMGLWLATSFVGNLMAGWLGGFWSSMDRPEFFLLIAAVSAVGAVAIWSVRPLLGPVLER
jgi:proton-dependent oligopeptide transporter, POT family